MHRIRAAIREQNERWRKRGVTKLPSESVRFIVAGEQGDRNGRCHWHIVLFSDVDLTMIRPIKRIINGVKRPVKDKADIISVGNKKIRCDWDLWPHGYVAFQEPNEGGMHYVLSYCLKDQFTEEKSHETKRQAKVENFATGLFRMSKRPAIGATWLWAKLQTLEQKGACLPSLNLKVPGFKGYYQPSGSFRQALLWSLVALNKRHVWATGKNLPQWPSLLSSVQDNQTDSEVLLGSQTEQADDVEQLDAQLAKRQRETAGFQARRDFARACGNVLPCEACLSQIPVDLLAPLGVERYQEFGAIFHRAAPGFAPVHERQRENVGQSNPFCRKRGSKISRHTFPDTDRTKLARTDV